MERNDRLLSIFFRGIKGEDISVKKLAGEYNISTKSVSRDIAEIKNFLSENRELVGETELVYNRKSNVYRLNFEEFLLSGELLTIAKILIGSRVFNKLSLLDIISKLKNLTTKNDGKLIDMLIEKEVRKYSEVRHECKDLPENIRDLTKVIDGKKEISVEYYKVNREFVTRRLRPVALIFSEYYFYLIAYKCEDEEYNPHFYRADRITHITVHRENFSIDKKYDFDEGELRRQIHFMFSGMTRKITFECEMQSLQAILDRIPTAKIISRKADKATIEAEVCGEGIKMFLLSQGDRGRMFIGKQEKTR